MCTESLPYKILVEYNIGQLLWHCVKHMVSTVYAGQNATASSPFLLLPWARVHWTERIDSCELVGVAFLSSLILTILILPSHLSKSNSNPPHKFMGKLAIDSPSPALTMSIRHLVAWTVATRLGVRTVLLLTSQSYPEFLLMENVQLPLILINALATQRAYIWWLPFIKKSAYLIPLRCKKLKTAVKSFPY